MRAASTAEHLLPGIEPVDETRAIVPRLRLIALVSDEPGTPALREPSLAIETPDGLVILVAARTRPSTTSPRPPRRPASASGARHPDA